MNIFVKVKPGAKEASFERIDQSHYHLQVKEPPRMGLANEAVLRALAENLNISRSRLKIVSGYTSRQKIIEIA